MSGNPNIAEYGKNTQFQPGVVTNPNGRPSGKRGIKTVIQRVLDNFPPEKIKEFFPECSETDVESAIWVKTAMQALQGDKEARRDITAYLYGKPVERVESKDVEEFTEVEEIQAEREKLEKEKQELSDGN